MPRGSGRRSGKASQAETKEAAPELPSMPPQDPMKVLQTLSKNSEDLKGNVTVIKPTRKRSRGKKAAKKTTKSKSTRKASRSPTTKKGGKKIQTRAVKGSAGKKGKPSSSRKTSGRRTDSAKKSPSKRSRNTDPTALAETGIGLSSSRVRTVMATQALNVTEHAVLKHLLAAENKPKKPKPTDKEPNPKMPKQGPQTPIADLPQFVQDAVAEAEEAYLETLRHSYDQKYAAALRKTKAGDSKYQDAKVAARKAAHEADEEFDVKAFNESFDSNFYSDFKSYCKKNDKYLTVKKKGSKKAVPLTEWGRAIALVSKRCVRLSGGTRFILTTFLDQIVKSYVRNGIMNCINDEKVIVMMYHAINAPSRELEQLIALHPWVATFSTYRRIETWMHERQDIKEQVAELKKKGNEVESTIPDFPVNDSQTIHFTNYVGEIFREIKMRMAAETDDEDLKERYLNASAGKNFKSFCNQIVFEAILRIGKSLALSIRREKVKTVSDDMVWFCIENTLMICGLPFDGIREVMNESLDLYNDWSARRRNKHRKNAEAKDAEEEVVEEVEDDEEEVVEEDEDEEEVEYDEEEVEYDEED